MDALKNRVGAFTEGVLTMACPVLLAISLKKVNGENNGNKSIGDTIFLAVTSLITCLLAFVFLVIANMLKRRNHLSPVEFLHRCSKLLVHICAILQTVLAYMILLVRLKLEQSAVHLGVSFLSIAFLLFWCVKSWKNGQKHDDDSYAGFEKKLDHSLDALTAVTSFLFLILVGLSLESQDKSHRLSLPMGFTFFICVAATCFMLMGAVPWPIQFGKDDQRRKEKCSEMCVCFDGMCLALTILLTIVVPMLIKPCTELAVGMVVFPWILVGAAYLLCVCEEGIGSQDQGDQQDVDQQRDTAVINIVRTDDNEAANPPSAGKNDGVADHAETGQQATNGDTQPASNDEEENKESATGNQPAAAGDNEEAKPASMGLTKAIFAGFLAVLTPSISSSAVSDSTKAFVVLAAGVVISGLLWRLLTHPLFCDAPKTATSVAADVACLLTYVLVMFAAVAFVVMAKDALAQDNTTCIIPCTSGHQISNLLRLCYWTKTHFHGERWSFMVSSVPC